GSRSHVLVQRLQHQSVAAECYHDVRVRGVAIAVKPGELRQRGLRLRSRARDKGDPLELAGGRDLLRTFGTHRAFPRKAVSSVIGWRARMEAGGRGQARVSD